MRNNFATATLFSVNGQCKKNYFGFYSRFRFEYFRYCFIFVFASIFVSIFVFVNDSNVFSLTIIFVFVNEINTAGPSLICGGKQIRSGHISLPDSVSVSKGLGNSLHP